MRDPAQLKVANAAAQAIMWSGAPPLMPLLAPGAATGALGSCQNPQRCDAPTLAAWRRRDQRSPWATWRMTAGSAVAPLP
eukprot:2881098-Pyramimonas_sp.AAC.1